MPDQELDQENYEQIKEEMQELYSKAELQQHETSFELKTLIKNATDILPKLTGSPTKSVTLNRKTGKLQTNIENLQEQIQVFQKTLEKLEQKKEKIHKIEEAAEKL